jgi:hypothetical protein
MKKLIFSSIFLLIIFISFSAAKAQKAEPTEKGGFPYKKGKLLYKDNFNKDLKNWVAEAPQNQDSRVEIEDNKLVIDVNEGTTVWFKEKLSGNLLIEYKRKVIMKDGKNDRLSDLNQFWMANDPAMKNLFTRSGIFSEYD